MADCSRSRSNGHGMVLQLDTCCHGPPPEKPSASGYNEFRCCSACSNSQSHMVKGNMGKAGGASGSSSSSSCSKFWSFGEPEFKRKKRVAGYKIYGAESKVRGSLKRSFRWIKDKYTQVVYGSWW
ncbi:hypothetical protein V6N13_051706 [Hibiscus sabdariffa]